MRYESTLLSVKDIKKSIKFYDEVFGLKVETDFGANVTLTGGHLALQTDDTWRSFINKKVSYGSNAYEIYFEEDDFDSFIEKLSLMDIEYVHPVKEHSWGQRAVRIYDPDRHIIEIGENMVSVVKRFLDSGMSAEETAVRMDVSLEYIKECMN
ncbi:MAG: VOC family protein [Candidatus Metalachnospira sp.]|nr:VOC family protein [Candidatus Metalachnospira sp.]